MSKALDEIQIFEDEFDLFVLLEESDKIEYLFDLDAAARSLLAKYGRSEEVDLIYKSY